MESAQELEGRERWRGRVGLRGGGRAEGRAKGFTVRREGGVDVWQTGPMNSRISEGGGSPGTPLSEIKREGYVKTVDNG